MTKFVFQSTRFVRLTRLFSAALTLVVAISRPSPAAEPAVIISFKNVPEFLDDMSYLEKVTQVPQWPFASLAVAVPHVMIFQQKGGQQLEGYDRSRPTGSYFTFSPDGIPKEKVGFVPVTDQIAFAATLESLAANAQNEGHLKRYEFPNDVSFIVKAGAKHFFFASTAEELIDTADPDQFERVTDDVSIEFDLTKPGPLAFSDFLSKVDASATEKTGGNTPRPINDPTEKLLMSALTRVNMDAIRLVFSLDIDSKTKNAMLALSLAAKPGSPLAQSCANLSKIDTPFTGLISQQTLASLLLSLPLSSDAEDWLKSSFNGPQSKSPPNSSSTQPSADGDAVDAFEKRTFELIRSTIQRGRLDQAAVINKVDGRLQFVGATKLPNGEQVWRLLEELAKLSPESVVEVKQNVAALGRTRIYAVNVPADEPVQKCFGPGPAHLAVTDDSALFVLGGDSLAGLNSALKRQATPVTRAPISGQVYLTKVLPLAQELGLLQIPPAVLEHCASAGNDTFDRIAVEFTARTQGLKVRLEVQEGVLRLAGIALLANLYN